MPIRDSSGNDSDTSDGSNGQRHEFKRGLLSRKDQIANRQLVNDKLVKFREGLAQIEAKLFETDAAQDNGYPASWTAEIRDLERLQAKNKELSDRVSKKQADVANMLERFSALSKAKPVKVQSVIDKYPDVGPMLIRLIPYYYGDPRDVTEVYKEYRDLISSDFDMLFSRSLSPTPAPSQNVELLQSRARAIEVENADLQKKIGELETWRGEAMEQASDSRKTETLLLEDRKAHVEETAKLVQQRQADIKRANSLQEQLAQMKVTEQEYLDEQSKLTEALESCKRDLQTKDNDIDMLNDRVNTLLRVGEDSTTALDSLGQTAKNLQGDQQRHFAGMKKLREDADAARSRLREVIHKLEDDKRGLEIELDQAKHVGDGLREQEASTRKVMNGLRKEVDRIGQNLLASLVKNGEQVSEIRDLKMKNVELNSACGELRVDVRTANSNVDISQRRVNEARDELRKLRDEDQVALQLEIDAYKTEVNRKTRQVEKHEALEKSARFDAQRWEQKYETLEQNASIDVHKWEQKHDEIEKNVRVTVQKHRALEKAVRANAEGWGKKYEESEAAREKAETAREDADAAREEAETTVQSVWNEFGTAEEAMNRVKAQKDNIKRVLDKAREDHSKAVNDMEKKHTQDMTKLTDQLSTAIEGLRVRDNLMTERIRDVDGLRGSLHRERTEKAGLERRVSELTSTLTSMERTIHTAGESALGQEQKVSGLELERRHLDDQLLQSRREASGQTTGLQCFLSELCGVSVHDCLELAGHLQAHGAVVAATPAGLTRHVCWTILETWTDEPALSRPADVSEEGLVPLGFELLRSVVSDKIVTWACQERLRLVLTAASCSHAASVPLFELLAHKFVRAVLSRPDDGFEIGLGFWQVMTVLEQRWPGLHDWDEAKQRLETFLQSHESHGIFSIVLGEAPVVEGVDCHFFHEDTAIISRRGGARAVLVKTKEKSLRFFTKTRWVSGLWHFLVRSPVQARGEGDITIPFANKEDLKFVVKCI